MGSFARMAVVILVAVPAVAWAGNGIWTSNGPYGGQTYDMVIDPATPSNLYASSRGGVFRSTDGAASWTRAQSGIVGSVSWDFPLMMDGDRPQRLYTIDTSGRLYRSTDGALNWSQTGFSVPADVAAWRLVDKPGAGTEGVFFLATQGGSVALTGPGLFRTTDDGATMPRLGGGLPNVAFTSVEVDPADPNRVLAGTDYDYVLQPTDPSTPAIWRSTDGGTNWLPVYSAGGSGISQRVDAIAYGAGSRVYAVVDCQVFRSDDDGATWAVTPSFCFGTLRAHPTVVNTVYAGGSAGLQVSTDGGATFGPSPNSLTPNTTYTDLLGRPLPAYVRRIVLDPAFPVPGAPIWAVTEGAGLFRSLDGGASFNNFDVNTGLAATNVRALAVHPSSFYNAVGGTSTTRPIYAGFGDTFYGSSAIWRSVNNGVTWPIANNGLRGSNIRAIVFDDTTVGAPGQVAPAPGLATSIVYAAGTAARNGVSGQFRNGGIYKSINGGSNWTTIDGGMPRSGTPPNDFANIGSTVRSLVLDPRSCASPPAGNARCGTIGGAGQSPLNTIWANASGRGALGWRILRSTDGGLTWASRDNGIPVPTVDGQLVTPIVMAMDPNDSNTLYQSTASTNSGGVSPLTIPNGVFRTTDGGANWAAANGPVGATGLPRYPGSTDTALDVLALAVHPVVSNIVWAATINIQDGSGTGIWKTTTGGADWAASSSGIPAGVDIRAIIVDRSAPNVLYASGGGSEANPGAVYKSDDAGVTWRSISIGLPADSALALALDPQNFNLIHAGTNLGVWDLTQVPDADGDGASNNSESVSPNPGGGSSGDGNGDGTPDALQGDVGSSIVLDAPQWEGRLGRGTQALIDAAPEGGALSFTSDIQGTACPQATDVQGVVAASYGRDYISGNSGRFYDYPRDLIRFEIPNCGSAVVDITFHNITFGGLENFNDYQWSFRFRGPQVPGEDATIGWYDLGARAQKVSATKWRITLDANQFGSYRPDNNSILFVGGPAFSNDRLLRNGFE